MNNEINIRSYKPEDIPQIIELLNTVFSKQQYFNIKRDYEWWNWKYENNIFGDSIIMVAEDEAKIVGVRALWAWKFVFRGKEIKAYQPCDTVVHPNYQGRGLFTKMTIKAVEKAIDNKTDFLFNFPNKNSLTGYLKLGWDYITKIQWFVKPLKPLKLLFAREVQNKAQPLTLESEYTINKELYEELVEKKRYDGLLRTYQTQDFFRWRYTEHPYFKYGYVQVTDGRKKLIGIFSINQKEKRREMIVVDILGSKELIERLMSKLIRTAKTLDVDMIAGILTNGYDLEKLKFPGFLKTKRKNLVALPLNIALEEKLLNINNWRLVGGMHDTL